TAHTVIFSLSLHDALPIFYHYDVWAKIAVGLSGLWMLGFVGFYFINRMVVKRIFFTLMLLFLLSSIVSIMLSVFEKNRAESYNPAIIFSEMIALKVEPRSVAADVITLHEGTKVFILEDLDDWLRVELADGTKGWLQKETVRSLKF